MQDIGPGAHKHLLLGPRWYSSPLALQQKGADGFEELMGSQGPSLTCTAARYRMRTSAIGLLMVQLSSCPSTM